MLRLREANAHAKSALHCVCNASKGAPLCGGAAGSAWPCSAPHAPRQGRQPADGCAAARQVNTNCEGKSLFTAPFQVGATPCLRAKPCLRFMHVPAHPDLPSSSGLLPLGWATNTQVCVCPGALTPAAAPAPGTQRARPRAPPRAPARAAPGLRAGRAERAAERAGRGVHGVGHEAHQRLAVLAEHAAVLLRRRVQRAGPHHRRRALRRAAPRLPFTRPAPASTSWRTFCCIRCDGE